MRRLSTVVAAVALVAVTAAPAGAATELDGPNPAIWLSDPDGVDGVAGIEQGDPIVGASGSARVVGNNAMIRVKATGLVPGHTYTMWVVYFNDQTLCIDGCNGADLPTGGGVIYGSGRIANGAGGATFVASLKTGDGADAVGEIPPPPFAFAPFEAGPNNEFHIVIRSHGPKIPGEVKAQLTSFGGGCSVEVGPAPEEVGDFPVPLSAGECGDIQLYVFK